MVRKKCKRIMRFSSIIICLSCLALETSCLDSEDINLESSNSNLTNPVVSESTDLEVTYSNATNSAVSGQIAESKEVKEIEVGDTVRENNITGCFENTQIREIQWPKLKKGEEKKEDPVIPYKVGNGAFSGCQYLEKIYFPAKQKMIRIPNHCFANCKVKELKFPKSTEAVLYDSQIFGDNYRNGGLEGLIFLGNDTIVQGLLYREKKGRSNLITAGKIIAPPNSKAWNYAKKAKKIEKMKKSVYTPDDVEGLVYPEFYEDWIRKGVRLAPMQCEELK